MRTLTTRYIDSVVQHLPEDGRADIAEEISGLISDMVDARWSAQSEADQLSEPVESTRDAVERSVLEELGDPVRLSRQYHGAPQHLIGPGVYPAYRRAMSWLMPLVGILAVLVNGVIYVLTTSVPAIGGLISFSIGNTVIALLTAFTAITLGLAVLERVVPAADLAELGGSIRGPWTVERLNEMPETQSSHRGEAVVSIIMLLALGAFPVIPASFFQVDHLAGSEPLINPDLYQGWLPAYWVLLAILLAMSIWTLLQGRLTFPATVAGVGVDALLAIYLTVVVATQDVVHPQIVADGETPGWLSWTLIAVIWTIFVWDQISTLRMYRSDRSRPQG